MLELKILYVCIGLLIGVSAICLKLFLSTRKKLSDYTQNTSSAAAEKLSNFSKEASNTTVNKDKKEKQAKDASEFEKYMHPNRVVDVPIYPHVIPLDWVGSIYDRVVPAHAVIKKEASASLIDCTAIKDLGYVSLIVYCQMVDIRNNKARLRVSDPYECIWTEPFDLKDNFNVSVFNGKIVRILGFADDGKLHVRRIIGTIYNKHIS